MSTKQIEVPIEYRLRFAGQEAQHSFYIHHVISKLFEEAKLQPINIIELGTAEGALSAYLGLWGARLGVPVYTFDNQVGPALRAALPMLERIGVHFEDRNLLSPDGEERVMGLIAEGSCYLYCDNGDKPKEFCTYAPLLASGSAISVHDWTQEIMPADVQGVVEEHKLQPYRAEWWTWCDAMMATWLVP